MMLCGDVEELETRIRLLFLSLDLKLRFLPLYFQVPVSSSLWQNHHRVTKDKLVS